MSSSILTQVGGLLLIENCKAVKQGGGLSMDGGGVSNYTHLCSGVDACIYRVGEVVSKLLQSWVGFFIMMTLHFLLKISHFSIQTHPMPYIVM